MTEYTKLQDVIQDYRAIKAQTEKSRNAYNTDLRQKALIALAAFKFVQGYGALTKVSSLLGESKQLINFYQLKYGKGGDLTK